MTAGEGLSLAWKVFLQEAIAAVEAAEVMGMEAKPLAMFYVRAAAVRDAVEQVMQAMDDIDKELRVWKADGTWEYRIARLHAAKLGVVKPTSMS